jgi:PadR family transcriptional regulator
MTLLAVLRLDDHAYGVPIARELKMQTRHEVPLGSIYATLDRLEAKGLVHSHIGESTPERGGRAKKYFAVTPKGLREAQRSRRALIALWKGVPQLEGDLL